MADKPYILCDVCHRVIWREDAIEDGEKLVCVNCVTPKEEDEDPSCSSGGDLVDP